MKISYYFKDMKPSNAIKEYTAERLKKLQDKFPNIRQAECRFYLDGELQLCEIDLHSSLPHLFHVKKANVDLYSAIEITIEVLSSVIDKYHKKIVTHSKDIPLGKILPKDDYYSDTSIEEPTDDPLNISIVEAEEKPMSDEDAILELINHYFKFYMYHRSNTKDYSLILPRKDMSYSIISPADVEGEHTETIVSYNHHTKEINVLQTHPYKVSQISIVVAARAIRQYKVDFLVFINQSTMKMNAIFFTKNHDLILKVPPL